MAIPSQRVHDWRAALYLNNSSALLIERGHADKSKDLLAAGICVMRSFVEELPVETAPLRPSNDLESALRRADTYVMETTSTQPNNASSLIRHNSSKMSGALTDSAIGLLSISTHATVTHDVLSTGMRPIYMHPVDAGNEPCERELEIQTGILLLNMSLAYQQLANDCVYQSQELFRAACRLLDLSLSALWKGVEKIPNEMDTEDLPSPFEDNCEALRVCPLCMLALQAMTEICSDILLDQEKAQQYSQIHEELSSFFSALMRASVQPIPPAAACA